MLNTVRDLLDRLNGDGIRYCHWKSNWALERTLRGETDLDLLIDRYDAQRFRTLLVGLGFEPSIETGVQALPSTEHHHALDAESGVIVHVHAYYRVISGESIAKNYRLPIEAMLLDNARREGLINVPARGAELIVFVLRMLVKHTTPVELAFLVRDWGAVRQEVEWLVTDAAIQEAEGLLARWMPRFDLDLFRQCVESLAASRSGLETNRPGFSGTSRAARAQPQKPPASAPVRVLEIRRLGRQPVDGFDQEADSRRGRTRRGLCRI